MSEHEWTEGDGVSWRVLESGEAHWRIKGDGLPWEPARSAQSQFGEVALAEILRLAERVKELESGETARQIALLESLLVDDQAFAWKRIEEKIAEMREAK